MSFPWLPWTVVGVAVLAVWGGARHAITLPLCTAVVLVAVLALPPKERRFAATPWVVAMVVVLGISWAVALDHELAMRHSLLVVVAFFLFGLARRGSITNRHLQVLVVAIGLTAALGVAQALGGLEGSQGMVSVLPPELREAAAARLAGGRAFGTAALPGHFALLLVMAAPLLVSRAVRSRPRMRWLTAGLLVSMALGVVASRSLAAVGVALLLLAAASTGQWSRRTVLLGAGAVLAVAVAALLLRGDLATIEPIRLRWLNWRATTWVIGEHPWLGVGLGGVGQAGLLAPSAAVSITPYSHNSLLQLAAELGLAGFGVVVAGVASLVSLLRRGFRDHLALTLAVAAVPLHNLVDFSAYAPEVLLPWVVLAGALAGRVLPVPPRPVPAALLIAVLAPATILQALSWRGEVELNDAWTGRDGVADTALRAGRWTPWALTPTLAAAGGALVGDRDPELLGSVERSLAARGWVRPRSASWAEARARLLLAQGQRGEALVWAREARRRAPWRAGMAALEKACAPPG